MANLVFSNSMLVTVKSKSVATLPIFYHFWLVFNYSNMYIYTLIVPFRDRLFTD